MPALEATVPSILLVVLVLLAGLVLAPSTAAALPPETVAQAPQQPSPADEKPKTRRGTDKTRKIHPVKPKKEQDETVTPNRGTVDAVGVVARGQTIDITATALRTGQTCTLQLFYADKQGPRVRDVVPDKHKRCTFSVTIPERPEVVGEAKIVVVFNKATSGKRDGTARQVFTIN